MQCELSPGARPSRGLAPVALLPRVFDSHRMWQSAVKALSQASDATRAVAWVTLRGVCGAAVSARHRLATVPSACRTCSIPLSRQFMQHDFVRETPRDGPSALPAIPGTELSVTQLTAAERPSRGTAPTQYQRAAAREPNLSQMGEWLWYAGGGDVPSSKAGILSGNGCSHASAQPQLRDLGRPSCRCARLARVFRCLGCSGEPFGWWQWHDMFSGVRQIHTPVSRHG